MRSRALTEWADDRLTQVSATTVSSDLSRLRLAWIDTTGHDRVPGLASAQLVAAGALRLHLQLTEPGAHSRPADDTDRRLVCAAVVEAVPAPSIRWAVRVLAGATGARRCAQVLDVDDRSAHVLIDDRRPVKVTPARAGVLCPVLAAQVAREAGQLLRPRAVDLPAILAAASVLERADPEFFGADGRCVTGMSSGEGLIAHLKDDPISGAPGVGFGGLGADLGLDLRARLAPERDPRLLPGQRFAHLRSPPRQPPSPRNYCAPCAASAGKA